jgi:hypothetical protein
MKTRLPRKLKKKLKKDGLYNLWTYNSVKGAPIFSNSSCEIHMDYTRPFLTANDVHFEVLSKEYIKQTRVEAYDYLF